VRIQRDSNPHSSRSGANYCDQRVCLSVCFVCMSETSATCPNFTKFSVHVTCGRVPVLHWRQYVTLCTSGLWMTSLFYIMGPMGQNQWQHVCFVEFARWQYLGRSCCLRLRACSFSVRFVRLTILLRLWWGGEALRSACLSVCLFSVRSHTHRLWFWRIRSIMWIQLRHAQNRKYIT